MPSMLRCKRRRVQVVENAQRPESDTLVLPFRSREALSDNGALPDFAIWPVAGHLATKDLGRLVGVGVGWLTLLYHDAFLSELLKERCEALRAPENIITLAQLSMAEEIASRQPLILVFGLMSDIVPQEAALGLRSLANLVQMHPKATVELEGHTSAGPTHLAERISRGRAEAVAQRLQGFGLNRRQLKVSWFGYERLLPAYPDPIHPKHRRVEVFVSFRDVRFRV